MNFGNPIRNPSVMMKASLAKMFLYDPSVKVYSDYIYWMEIVQRNIENPYLDIKFG